MSDAAVISPSVHGTAPVSNAKLAIWIFLASEVMFFAGLLGSYIVLRVGKPYLFNPSHLNVPLAAFNTLVLICSSYTMALGVHSVRLRNTQAVGKFLLLTAGLGIAFCLVKAWEYYGKFSDGIYPSTGLFYSCYFALTGIHLLHVIAGVLPLLVFFFLSRDGRFTRAGSEAVEILGLYWHFVDVVWIFLFPLLYLIHW